MLLNAVRVGTEVAGALAAGMIAAEVIAPSLHGNDFNECLDKKSEMFVTQSGSLSTEFIDICQQLQASSMKRILDICTSNDNDRRAVAATDIDEFLSNLTNDDPEMDIYPVFFAENLANDPNLHGTKRQQVLEQYRIIPLSEVAKLNNSFGTMTNSNNATHASSSSSSSSSWFRPSSGGPLSPHHHGRVQPVAEVLAALWERDRCAVDLLDNFQLQVIRSYFY